MSFNLAITLTWYKNKYQINKGRNLELNFHANDQLWELQPANDN